MAKKIKFNKTFLVVISLFMVLLLMVLYNVDINFTGFASSGISVNISETLSGEITAFTYSPTLNLSEIQNITVEFTNTGNVVYNTTIFETVYIYDDGNLNRTAQFYDYTSLLYPGERKHYRASYVPPMSGTYYIKAVVHYGPRRAEAWGVFVVVTPSEGNETGPPGDGGVGDVGWTPVQIIRLGTPVVELDLDYPNLIDMYQGQTMMVGVRGTNTGNTTLRRLRMYVSTPDTIEIEVNPKEVYDLFGNDSTAFLLSIHVKEEAAVGIHLIRFDIVSDRLKQTGLIELNVTPEIIAREKEIQNRILNNRYLILEVERQILTAFKKDVDTSLTEALLNEAKTYLEAAEEYLNLAELEKAIEELDKKDEKLKNAVFELAHESFRVYYPPAFSPIWILLFMILLAFIFFIIFQRRKKKKKKPKLLRRTEEESEA
jgi:hypothetical protein